MVFSKNTGETFSQPIRIDDGKPIGRVDVVLLDAETALASWVETVGERGEIRLAKVDAQGKIGESITASKTGISRRSGFPIMTTINEKVLLAWTNVDSLTTIKTLSFRVI